MKIKNTIIFADGREFSIQLQINDDTLLIENQEVSPPPAWAKLEFQQCSNCPLSKQTSPFCPIAKNLSQLATNFTSLLSHEKVKCIVESHDRTVIKNTDIQSALFSMFGLIMASSGCPRMNFLKPMAYFHLPFASVDEHLVRSTSFYLLKQYFNKIAGKKFDIDLVGLKKHYEQLTVVNEGFAKRIGSIDVKDSNKNALVLLHSIGQMLSMEFDMNLETLQPIFSEAVTGPSEI